MNCSLPAPQPGSLAQLAQCTGSPRPKATQLVCGRAGLAREALDNPIRRPCGGSWQTSGLAWPIIPFCTPASPFAELTALSLAPTHNLQLLDSRAWVLAPPVLCPHLLCEGTADLGQSALGMGARVAFVWAGPAWAQALYAQVSSTSQGFAPSPLPAPLWPPWQQPLLAGSPPGPQGPAFASSSQQGGEGAVPGSPLWLPLPASHTGLGGCLSVQGPCQTLGCFFFMATPLLPVPLETFPPSTEKVRQAPLPAPLCGKPCPPHM